MSGPLLTVRYMSVSDYITLTGPVQTVTGTIGGVLVGVDITITICLCMLLAMSRTGFHPECPFQPSIYYVGIVQRGRHLARIECFSD
jgi:hypothetical protein